MISQNKLSIKNIILIFAPIFATAIIQFIVSFVDVIILLAINMLKDKALSKDESASSVLNADYKSPDNIAYMTMAQYILYLVFFSLWFYFAFVKDYDNKDKALLTKKGLGTLIYTIKKSAQNIFSPVLIIALAILGYSGQLFTDAILNLVRNAAPKLFTDYDKLVDTMVGAYASPVMLISVFLLAPIAEEVIFRGIALSYSKETFIAPLSCILNGLLFGLYHGNLIQGIYAFVFGVILSIIALHFNSILPGIIVHLAVNCSVLLSFDIFFSSNMANIITLIICLCIFTGLLLFVLKDKYIKKIDTAKNKENTDFNS